MRKLLALGAFLALAPAAQAQDFAAEQMCYTWLSLAAYHALPEGDRAGFGEISTRMNAYMTSRTDVDTSPNNPAVKAAIDAYSGWLSELGNSSDAAEIKLREELAGRARECEPLVPAETAQ